MEASKSLEVVDKDPHDDKVFEAAVEGKANYLVSGDNALLEVEGFQGVQTLSPRKLKNFFSGAAFHFLPRP